MPDLMKRGSTTTNPAFTLTLVGLRALDLPLQHAILSGNIGTSLIERLGSSVFSQGPTSSTGFALIDSLQLSPYRLAILGMATMSTIKHAFWATFIAREEYSVSAAGMVSAINSVFNSLNSLLLICKATSAVAGRGEGPNWPGWPGYPLIFGGGIFLAGIAIEMISEVQRKAFKDKPENKGRCYTGGLFGFARHINYTGYTLWRTGYALACGGPLWAGAVGGLFLYNFATGAVPELDEYCTRRYADLWAEYKKEVPYKLIPGVY